MAGASAPAGAEPRRRRLAEQMKFRFLGTGTSVGVPQIGCGCRVCTSADPRDRRRRCGAYVVADSGEAFLVDTPPELRLACIEYGISRVDAVVLTHAHMDHVAGFDDVRRFNTINGVKVPVDGDDPRYRGLKYRVVGKPLPCYALDETIAQMHAIFPYISAKGGEMGLYRPQIEFRGNSAPFSIGGIELEAVRVEHGFPCCGYVMRERGASLAYISDCHAISEEGLARLRGLDVLVLNCLREREHPTHLSLARCLEYIGRIAPRKAYIVHMCHDLTHEDWLKRLSGTVAEPAWDGLEIEL